MAVGGVGLPGALFNLHLNDFQEQHEHAADHNELSINAYHASEADWQLPKPSKAFPSPDPMAPESPRQLSATWPFGNSSLGLAEPLSSVGSNRSVVAQAHEQALTPSVLTIPRTGSVHVNGVEVRPEIPETHVVTTAPSSTAPATTVLPPAAEPLKSVYLTPNYTVHNVAPWVTGVPYVLQQPVKTAWITQPCMPSMATTHCWLPRSIRYHIYPAAPRIVIA